MPAGPVGSVWAAGSWSDTCWEAGTWADAVDPPPSTGTGGYNYGYRCGPLALFWALVSAWW